MGLFKLVKTVLPLAALVAGCYSQSMPIPTFSNLKFHKAELTATSGPSKENLEILLDQVWNSGFLVKDPLLKKEILDNKYGIFTKENMPEDCKRIGGCDGQFIINEELVLLNQNIFPRKIIPKDTTTSHLYQFKASLCYSTLIHELFHDFWYNLLSKEIKKEFTAESEKFFKSILEIKSEHDKLNFLHSVGFVNPQEGYFDGYERLLIFHLTISRYLDLYEYKENIKEVDYNKKEIFATEFYSVIAERAFAKRIIVPMPLRKFYKGFISEAALNKNNLR